jgi:hypothetical protein
MTRTVWSAEAWAEFLGECRSLHGAGLRGDALWKRIEQAMLPVYASADPADHAQVYEDAVRHLVYVGILPQSYAPVL